MSQLYFPTSCKAEWVINGWLTGLQSHPLDIIFVIKLSNQKLIISSITYKYQTTVTKTSDIYMSQKSV